MRRAKWARIEAPTTQLSVADSTTPQYHQQELSAKRDASRIHDRTFIPALPFIFEVRCFTMPSLGYSLMVGGYLGGYSNMRDCNIQAVINWCLRHI